MMLHLNICTLCMWINNTLLTQFWQFLCSYMFFLIHPSLGNGKLGLSVVFKPITSEIKSIDAKNFSLCTGFTFCFPENNARNIR